MTHKFLGLCTSKTKGVVRGAPLPKEGEANE